MATTSLKFASIIFARASSSPAVILFPSSCSSSNVRRRVLLISFRYRAMELRLGPFGAAVFFSSTSSSCWSPFSGCSPSLVELIRVSTSCSSLIIRALYILPPGELTIFLNQSLLLTMRVGQRLFMKSFGCPPSGICSAPTDALIANRSRALLKAIKIGLLIIDRKGIPHSYFSSKYFATFQQAAFHLNTVFYNDYKARGLVISPCVSPPST